MLDCRQANPGERTDWDLCYDVLYLVLDRRRLGSPPQGSCRERTFREQGRCSTRLLYRLVPPSSGFRSSVTEELQYKQLDGRSSTALDKRRIHRREPGAHHIGASERPGQTSLTHVHLRGEWNRTGASRSTRSTLSVLAPANFRGPGRKPRDSTLRSWLVFLRRTRSRHG